MAAQGVAQSVPDTSEPKRAEDGRLMYCEHQLQRSRYYRGCLDDMTIDEVRALAEELFSYAGFDDIMGFPLPPAGLPGHVTSKYDYAEPAADLISIGVAYLCAVATNERRTMHNRWKEARAFIDKIKERTREECWEEEVAERTRRAEAEIAAAVAAKQYVYFIGAASGPIKIGIATRPLARLSGLQTSHHEKLDLLATCEGDLELEKAYHRRFAAHRLSGEWFERTPELMAEIERLTPNTFAQYPSRA